MPITANVEEGMLQIPSKNIHSETISRSRKRRNNIRLEQGEDSVVAYIQEPPTEIMLGNARYSG